VSFAAVQPAPLAPPTATQVANYDAPTLLTTRESSPITTGDLLGAWVGARQRHLDAVTLLCGPLYAPFIYGQHRYASIFQAAEALAKEAVGTRDRDTAGHRARVDTVATVLTDADLEQGVVDWAVGVLKSRNHKSLRDLIDELTASTGGLGQRVLAEIPDLGKRVARARVGVSHGGAEGVGPLPRHWLGEVLSLVVRVWLLADAGVPLDHLTAKALSKPRLARALAEITVPSR
jgi:hypothetical protein